MDNPSTILFRFVLERCEGEPLRKRAELYRALAQVVGDEKLAKRLIAMAGELEACDRKHRQLGLDFEGGTQR